MTARARPAPALVVVEELPAYPIARDERLPELAFVKWVPSRWLNSSGHLKCTYEVQGMARALFDIATAQSPIGTLPDDDEELAALLRVPQSQWKTLRGMGDRGPLRNWVQCRSDGEVRLMHPVVTAQLQEVLHRREQRELSREAQAEAKRMDRLAKGLQQAGLNADVSGDMILLKRIDDWLKANWLGSRTMRAHLAALEAARQQGWI
ncbi:hypothetical protein DWF04_015740 [Cereibacter sphaeroides f. sp. denitrificans]